MTTLAEGYAERPAWHPERPRLRPARIIGRLISFHGGLGGPQTRAFVLSPQELPPPDGPLVGAAAVHDLLAGRRRSLQQ